MHGSEEERRSALHRALASAVERVTGEVVVVAHQVAEAQQLAAAIQEGPSVRCHAVSIDGAIPVAGGAAERIVYLDVFSKVDDLVGRLRRDRSALTTTGSIVCSVPNAQHHEWVSQLLRGDVEHRTGAAGARPWTYAAVFKALLDAGFVPDLTDTVGAAPWARRDEARPLLDALRVDPARADRYLLATDLILSGRPSDGPQPEPCAPMTFVVCVNDDAQLRANLLRSPCLADDTPHEVLLYHGSPSAAVGLNAGIEAARNELVVLTQQDVYFPAGWPAAAQQSLAAAEASYGPIGVAGVFGIQVRSDPEAHIGHIIDRDRRWELGAPRPAIVEGLDEAVLIVSRSSPVRPDPALGWHLYGTDMCLTAERLGRACVVIDALCFHNSQTGSVVPPAYRDAETVLAHKWPDELPIHTNSSTITEAALAAATPPPDCHRSGRRWQTLRRPPR